MKGQQGFTLAETLIVLAVFMILSTVTLFSLKPQYSMFQTQSFLTQLKADLYFAQNYALSHKQDVSVIFTPSECEYTIYVHNEKQRELIHRRYDKSIYVYKGTLPLAFKYQANGNVSKFGTFFIKTKRKTYQMTILIGRGRFYLVEK
jgi:competence protein ComGD